MRRNLGIICKASWIEFFRRKEFYVVFILMSLFGLGVGVTRLVGVDSAATAGFLMSFGLSMSYLLAALLAVMMTSRQMPGEIENRTLHTMLAKPVTRGEVLIGKVLATTSIASLTLIILASISYFPTPKSEEQSLLALAQAIALQCVGLGVLAGLTTMLTFVFSTPVAALIAVAVFFFGGAAVNYATLAMEQVLGAGAHVGGRLLSIVPDFSVFNHVERFVQGQEPIALGSFLAILAYGAGLFAVFHLVGAWLFERKSI